MLFIKDLPLQSSVDLKVTQPAIYFGELSNDHVFVKTATQEFDYPRGDANVFGTYCRQGRCGALAACSAGCCSPFVSVQPDTLFSPNLDRRTAGC